MSFYLFNTALYDILRQYLYIYGANLVQILHRKLMDMATANYYLDTRRIKANGKYPLKIRVQHRGKFLISTDFDAVPETWSINSYNRKESNWQAKNVAVRNLMNRLEKIIFSLDEEGLLLKMSDKELKEAITSELEGNKIEERTFIDCLDEFVSTKTNKGTITVYTTTRNKILSFDPKCTFSSMDRSWLVRFEKWMASQGMKVNAYAIHLRNVRTVFNYALDEGYTSMYPFRKFSIGKEETRKRSLTVGQLRTLRDYPCEEWQEKYRDIFMLMFYLIGINAVDLLNARNSDVVNGRLEYKRAKTGKLYSILIEPEAWKS